ncbi:MAG: Lrp/AsnC family transcriptional regulator [Verrucomicrobiota bacterium]
MTSEIAPSPVPVEHTDPVNSQILAVSEDLVSGFQRYPFQHIAAESGVALPTVLERIRTMLEAGVIRRVRQTLLATKLAHGALCAWKTAPRKLDETFEWMFNNDPFSGHVVTRTTDRAISGSDYKLWTTLKVPQGESLEEHAEVLRRLTRAEEFVLMPAHGIFALGVGHVRRKSMEIGARSPEPAVMTTTRTVELTPEEWEVLLSIKEELSPEEVSEDPWGPRAAAIGYDRERYFEIAERLDQKQAIGRFSTFLEHVKPSQAGQRVTRFNALFHWKVPEGRQEEAGGEVGRHDIMTHAYWREGGSRFGNVNIMGVVHGTEKSRVLEHKAAIDAHLENCGIPVDYTNVFWGGRSEIKPSEISPVIYQDFHQKWRDADPVL